MTPKLTDPDLFVLPPQSTRPRLKKGGYADHPGTGPEGETCKSCQHLARVEYANVYLKCALMRAKWTGGGGTDVKARAPACSKWESRK